jgi:hypothetical protein
MEHHMTAQAIRRVRTALLILLFGDMGGLGLSACSGDRPGALCYPSDQPGVTCEPYPVLTQDDLPDCQNRLTSADVACAMKLFAPLAGPPWPFDSDLVGKAVTALHGGAATYVAPSWQLTCEHVFGNACSFPTAYRYATDGVPFDEPTDCGPFLMVGGNPRTTTCAADQEWDCWETVPLEEVFDTCLVGATVTSASYLPVAPSPPAVGDRVYVVGNPGFNWSAEQRQQYSLPLVSVGNVVQVQGRALVMTAAAFNGDSGGAVLNADGQLVGVLSSLVGDVREQGVVTLPSSLPDYYSICTLVDDPTRAIIQTAAGTGG